jgi:hypothetical protein
MSPETPAPAAPADDLSSRAATHAVIAAGIAITAFGLLAIASALGWLPKVGDKTAGFDPDKAGAITRPDPGPPRSTVPLASALLPGETLVAEPEPPHAAPPSEPLMPRYGDPVVPRPAPPRPVEKVPEKAPVAASAPVEAPRTAPTTPRWIRTAPERTSTTERARDSGIPIRPLPPARYAEVARPAEPRSRSRCAHCGVVTEITPWIDQWDVHVRFEDGSRRVLRYPAPPNVSRGDRVVFENGRLRPD